MAKANLGGNASARKSPRIAFDRSSGTPASAHDNPTSLSADLGAAILALVKESTQAVLRDLLTQSPGSGPRAVATSAPNAVTPEVATAPADIAPNAALSSDPAIITEAVTATLPGEPPGLGETRLRLIGVDELEPVIVLANSDERSALGSHELLQSPGFYAGIWDDSKTAYPGFGENVGGRAATNPDLVGATRYVCICDRHGRLTAQQGLVGERLFGQMLQQSGELSLRNKLPVGAPVEPADYDTMRLFVARACLALRQAGVLFTTLPAAALLLPPAKPPAFRPIEPDTTVYRLTVSGLRAHVTEEEGEWRLLAGSEVRAEVQASAYGPAMMGRAELIHCGGLLRTGQVLSTTRDLRFSSAWAAAHFVLGQKPHSDIWKPIPAVGDTSRPRP